VEELAQEVVRAVAGKNFRAVQALLLTDDDLRTLGTPAREVTRIKDLQKQSQARFNQTLAKLSHLNENTRYLHLESTGPSRLPAENTGMRGDVLMYYRAMILTETGGKTDWIQLGEIVQVGEAWKLIDSPLPGDADAGAGGTQLAGGATPVPAEGQELFKKLADLDATAPQGYVGYGANPAVVRYQLQRADVITQILQKVGEAERAQWWRQLVDSVSTAAQASPANDTAALARLGRLADQLAREAPGSELAGYAAFRYLTTEHTLKTADLRKPEDMQAAQAQFVEKLTKFVATYPKSEDAADALLQLGNLHEYPGNKEKEAQAQKWYEQLTRQFPGTRQAAKAAGALRRLTVEGRTWELNAQPVSLNGMPFSMDRLRGKFVIVYYWVSGSSTTQDFEALRKIAQTYRSQLEIVAVNVDENQAEAAQFVRQTNPPGYQLFAGGLEGPAATHYGLVVFPNLFLVGRDGKVLSRTVEISSLEEELKKLTKQ
jgi:hypothetical protein